MTLAVGCTGKTTPWKSCSTRLWRISYPIEPRRLDAPITAIDRGRKMASSGSGVPTRISVPVSAAAGFVKDPFFLRSEAGQTVLGDLVEYAIDFRLADPRRAARATRHDFEVPAPPARHHSFRGSALAPPLQIREPDHHAADVREMRDPVPAARDAGQDLDRRQRPDQVLRLDGDQKPQEDIPVREQHRERDQDSEHRARGPDHGAVVEAHERQGCRAESAENVVAQ